MSDVTPGRFSAVWKMCLVVLTAWAVCGAYRWRYPAGAEATAVLQVPPATDLGTLCQRPEIRDAAISRLEADGDIDLFLHQSGKKPQLSGKLIARKLRSVVRTEQGNSQNGASDKSTDDSTETWELTWQSPRAEQALEELSAIVAVLEARFSTSASSAVSDTPGFRLNRRIKALEADKRDAQRELGEIPDGAVTTTNDDAVVVLRERLQSSQKSLETARLERRQFETEWKGTEKELLATQRLEGAAAKLPEGPVREVVLQLERERKLSAQLKQLDETDRRLSEVYGDKHPQLIEVRAKFERLLSEIGGWEKILDEANLNDRLHTDLEQLFERRREQEAELQMQVELDQTELAELTRSTTEQTEIAGRIRKMDQDLKDLRAEQSALPPGLPATFAEVQPPTLQQRYWLRQLGILLCMATICGLAAGWMVHRLTSPVEEPELIPVVATSLPPVAPPPAGQLDLAQRRALRQARLQQAYA